MTNLQLVCNMLCLLVFIFFSGQTIRTLKKDDKLMKSLSATWQKMNGKVQSIITQDSVLIYQFSLTKGKLRANTKQLILHALALDMQDNM